MDKEYLISFEKELVQRYLNKEIKSPIHLCGGNEENLIEIFKKVKSEDWIFATYRSHYHALLKGMPRDKLLAWVLANKSIHLMDKEFKIVTSSIVGGTLSQAVGAALAIKLKQEERHVWAFCGDMAAETGAFHECVKYATRHDLPITFVIEDNDLSVDTPTQVVWGQEKTHKDNIIRFKYKRIYPHYGVGARVSF